MGASLSADGASLSGTNDFALDAMAKSVHFSKDELQKMQSAFMKIAADSPEAGSTVITLEQFGRALNNVEVPAGAGNFLGLLFNAFDKNGDGVLNYVEFCAGLSIILKGTSDEKYHMCFDIYDVEKTGYISKSEMRKVLTAMNVVLRATESQNRAFSEADVETFVKTLFEEAGANDRLNYDDFVKVVKNHPEIIDF